jgi:catechol 2,3-dioxygenase-like lactoylglutathione lyase family enzyme
MATQPHPLDHVGLTVPDLERAVEFYTEVMGFQLLLGPVEISSDMAGPQGAFTRDIFGEDVQARLAHLLAANGTGLELFEFEHPTTATPDDNFHFNLVGPFHFNVVDPDIERLAERVEEYGGRRRTDIHRWDDDLPFRLVYLEDPFGNILECYTHPYAQIYATLAARQPA